MPGSDTSARLRRELPMPDTSPTRDLLDRRLGPGHRPTDDLSSGRIGRGPGSGNGRGAGGDGRGAHRRSVRRTPWSTKRRGRPGRARRGCDRSCSPWPRRTPRHFSGSSRPSPCRGEAMRSDSFGSVASDPRFVKAPRFSATCWGDARKWRAWGSPWSSAPWRARGATPERRSSWPPALRGAQRGPSGSTCGMNRRSPSSRGLLDAAAEKLAGVEEAERLAGRLLDGQPG